MRMDDTEMTRWKGIAFEAVAEICAIKSSSGREPASASLVEIMNSVQPVMLEALRGLCRDKKIKYHMTVNGVPMFGVV